MTGDERCCNLPLLNAGPIVSRSVIRNEVAMQSHVKSSKGQARGIGAWVLQQDNYQLFPEISHPSTPNSIRCYDPRQGGIFSRMFNF